MIFPRVRSLFRSIIMTTVRGARFFVNPKPDYEAEFGTPLLPTAELKESLQSIVQRIETHLKPVEKNAGDGIYLGTAGIAYMYYHLSKNPNLADHRHQLLNKAIEYLKPALVVVSSMTSRNDIPGFILGNGGVYAVAATIFKAVGDEAQSSNYRQLYYEAAHICKDPNFLNCGSDELFVGRAGYVMGALWLAKETNTSLQQQEIFNLCKTIVQSGRSYAKRHHSPCPLMYAYYKVEYLGAAHGLCAILQALLSVPGYLDAAPSDAADIKSSVDFLITLQDKEGNFPSATDEIGYNSELVHWCHGAGGMIYLMAKAYLVFKDQKYLESCQRMGNLVWEKGLLRKGPGICHGVAGNGYVFLLLYRLTLDDKYLYRAIQFFRFMSTEEFQNGARTPDYPYSLYEGWAGTACYIADLINPHQASFPFSDVF